MNPKSIMTLCKMNQKNKMKPLEKNQNNLIKQLILKCVNLLMIIQPDNKKKQSLNLNQIDLLRIIKNKIFRSLNNIKMKNLKNIIVMKNWIITDSLLNKERVKLKKLLNYIKYKWIKLLKNNLVINLKVLNIKYFQIFKKLVKRVGIHLQHLHKKYLLIMMIEFKS